MRVKVATRTEIGLVREHNEDDLLVDEQQRLFVVADGLGGHVAGEVASSTAVRAAHAAFIESAATDPQRALPEALHLAHEAVMEEAAADPSRRGMGTTAVVATLSPDDRQLWVSHVGDSRAYLMRSGQLHRLTADHRIGGGNLTQALGTSGEIEPDTARVDLQTADRVLLCTDGLTDMLGDDEIATHVASGEPEQSCDRLVDAAMANGGIDNVTLVLIEVDG